MTITQSDFDALHLDCERLHAELVAHENDCDLCAAVEPGCNAGDELCASLEAANDAWNAAREAIQWAHQDGPEDDGRDTP